MTKPRLIILGNSVPIRMRPRKKEDHHFLYSELLSNSGKYHVTNLGVGASICSDLETNDLKAEVFIINYGIVEASTRPVSRKLYTFLNQPTHGLYLFKAKLIFILKALESKLRPQLVKLRGRKSWVSLSQFENNMTAMLTELAKSGSKVIVLGINKPSERIENQLPGTIKNVIKFNDFLEKFCTLNNCSFIPLYHLVPPEQMPDGIHFNHEGHEMVAKLIEELL